MVQSGRALHLGKLNGLEQANDVLAHLGRQDGPIWVAGLNENRALETNKDGGRRREELLLPEKTLNRMYILRKVLQPLSPVDSMEFLLEKIKATDTNQEFPESMNS